MEAKSLLGLFESYLFLLYVFRSFGFDLKLCFFLYSIYFSLSIYNLFIIIRGLPNCYNVFLDIIIILTLVPL